VPSFCSSSSYPWGLVRLTAHILRLKNSANDRLGAEVNPVSARSTLILGCESTRALSKEFD
jgi:hypothetical protein